MRRKHDTLVLPMPRQERGAVLIVSLLILLVLTVLGVTSMQTTLLEEKMAGNLHNRNLAFEAAENALDAGEAYVEGLVTTGGFDGTGGLYGADDSAPDHFNSATWSASNSRAGGSIPGTAGPPRYVIKIFTTVENQGGALNQKSYGGSAPASDVTMFRITARGVGGTDTARVYLQTQYGKIF